MSSLGKSGYVLLKKDFKKEEIAEIKKNLTVQPIVQQLYSNQEPKSFCLYQENDKKLYLPRYYGLNEFGKPTKNNFNKIKDNYTNYNFKLTPREYQKVALKIILKNIYSVGGGILYLPPAYGKTFLALKLAHLLGVKTLVITHQDFLTNQWITKIQMYSDASIGIIKQKKVDIEDKDIVVGMLQSISKGKYPKEVFDSFDLLIVDECHHISAEVFSKALKFIRPKYTIGLTATPERKDGLTKVFKWFLGDVIFQDKIKIENTVYVNTHKFQDDSLQIEKNFNGVVNIPKIITNISKCERRNDLILNIVKDLAKNKRNILILSERRDHLIILKEMIDELELCTTGLYIGQMKQKDLDESMNKDIMLGTYAMIAEAFDNDRLNTLILATPKSDVVQIVGRILRKEHGEKNAIIIDIIDDILKHQYKKRKKHYDKEGYYIDNFKKEVDKKDVSKVKSEPSVELGCLF
jgi:superfamily II DNA or RNA helicase